MLTYLLKQVINAFNNEDEIPHWFHPQDKKKGQGMGRDCLVLIRLAIIRNKTRK